MSGVAVFSGSRHQCGVIAVVYAHLLAQRPLQWVHPLTDVPHGVWGETNRVGDDVRIELGLGRPAIEVQAKHGLTAGASLVATLQGALHRDAPGSTDLLVVVVDRASTKSLYTHLAQDLERLRMGRMESQQRVTTDLLEDLPAAKDLLSRLYVVTVDADLPGDPERKIALELIANCLDDPRQAASAYAIFESDAQTLCASQSARTRPDLVALLAAAGIRVKPSAPSDRWHTQLDVTRSLVETHHNEAALHQLNLIEAGIASDEVEPRVRYRLLQQRASALLRLDRWADAETWARRAALLAQEDVSAEQTLVSSLVRQGRLQEAAIIAEEAARRAPTQEAGWIALAMVASARGEPPPTPPPSIDGSVRFRSSQIVNAATAGRWEEVAQLAAKLFLEEKCPPEVYVFAAQGIAVRSGPADRSGWEQVRFLTTQAIDLIQNDAHPLTPQALALRAAARAHLGDQAGELEDVAQAKRLAPDEPEMIAHMVTTLAARGKIAEALQILGHPVVEASAFLLAQRAGLLVNVDRSRALSDLQKSVGALPDDRDPAGARLRVADAAIVLGQLDLAREMLVALDSDVTPHEFWRRLLTARLAAEEGNSSLAREWYDSAAALRPEDRAVLMVELAGLLGEQHLFSELVEILQGVPEDVLPAVGQHMLAAALLETYDTVGAAALLERARNKDGSLPEWGMRIAVEIAVRQDDPTEAIRSLGDLLRIQDGDIDVRLELVRHLLEYDQTEEAQKHVELLVAREDLTPRQQMQVAHALLHIGREAEALRRGVAALRRAPADPNLHRQLVGLSMKAKEPPPVPTEIGPNTHVVLTGTNGERREFTIWSDLPRDPLRHEISLEEAVDLRLVGREVGARVVLHPGGPSEQILHVAAISTAQAFLIGDTMSRYGERFPTAPPFLINVPVGELDQPGAFSGLVEIAHRRRASIEVLFKQYSESSLPLGFLAQRIGTTVADLLASLGDPGSGAGVVFVQWSAADARAEALQAARDTETLVLDTTAISVLHDLMLLEAVLSRYQVLIAESASRELESWAREAEGQARDGTRTMGVQADGRPFLFELEGGADVLTRRAAHFRARCERLQSAIRRPRPLASIAPPGSEADEERKMLGASSYDTVQLARAERAPLCADDLGLRVLTRSQLGGPSVCSMDLIQVLAEERVISRAEYHTAMVELGRRGFAFSNPKAGTLVFAADQVSQLGGGTVRRVFEGLAQDGMSLAAAAEIVSQAAREAALAEIQLATPRFIVLEAVSAMVGRWPVHAVVPALRAAGLRSLALLPKALEQMESAIASLTQDPG